MTTLDTILLPEGRPERQCANAAGQRRVTLRARGVTYHKAASCEVETLSTAHAAGPCAQADLRLRQFVGSAAECLQRTAEGPPVSLTRVRAFAQAEVEPGAVSPGAPIPLLGHIQLRLELESEATREALDGLMRLAQSAIASEAASHGARVSVSFEHLVPLDTDM